MCVYVCNIFYIYARAGRIFLKITSLLRNEREEVTPAVRYSPWDRQTVIYKERRTKKKKKEGISSNMSNKTKGFLEIGIPRSRDFHLGKWSRECLHNFAPVALPIASCWFLHNRRDYWQLTRRKGLFPSTRTVRRRKLRRVFYLSVMKMLILPCWA